MKALFIKDVKAKVKAFIPKEETACKITAVLFANNLKSCDIKTAMIGHSIKAITTYTNNDCVKESFFNIRSGEDITKLL